VRAAVGRTDLHPPKWPDPVNLFADVAICMDGSLVVGPPPSRPGDHVIPTALDFDLCPGTVVMDVMRLVSFMRLFQALQQRRGWRCRCAKRSC